MKYLTCLLRAALVIALFLPMQMAVADAKTAEKAGSIIGQIEKNGASN